MRRIHVLALNGLVALFLVVGLTGCDAFEVFDRDKETGGIVEEIGADFIVVDGVTYRVTSNTEFEGIDGLGDLSVGDEVEIEYKGEGSERTALEIEFGEEEDDDGGLFGKAGGA